MITDKLGEFSRAQAITSSAVSTNVIDHGSSTDVGPGRAVRIAVNVGAAFTNLTSLTIELQTCATEGGTYKSLSKSVYPLAGDVAHAALNVANTRLSTIDIPPHADRFLGLLYTVTGTTETTGTITAVIVDTDQQNAALPGSP